MSGNVPLSPSCGICSPPGWGDTLWTKRKAFQGPCDPTPQAASSPMAEQATFPVPSPSSPTAMHQRTHIYTRVHISHMHCSPVPWRPSLQALQSTWLYPSISHLGGSSCWSPRAQDVRKVRRVRGEHQRATLFPGPGPPGRRVSGVSAKDEISRNSLHNHRGINAVGEEVPCAGHRLSTSRAIGAQGGASTGDTRTFPGC